MRTSFLLINHYEARFKIFIWSCYENCILFKFFCKYCNLAVASSRCHIKLGRLVKVVLIFEDRCFSVKSCLC